jgi:ABC-2 type transport system ATP-binding protein
MLIDIKNVSYSIPGGMSIFKNLNLKVQKNEFYGVLGKNGAGKSTLIEIIMGMRKLETGSVELMGENPNSSRQKKKSDTFVVTHDMTIPSNIKVKDLHKYYKFFYPNYSEEIEQQLLKLFEIDNNKKMGTLSTGQKIKAMLCGAFAARASLYLFDEVTAVLDPKSRRNFFKFLKEYRIYHSCSVLLATNIAEDLTNSVDKVIFIDDDHKVLVKDIDELDNLFEDDITEEVA